jgi:hypothetical protein
MESQVVSRLLASPRWKLKKATPRRPVFFLSLDPKYRPFFLSLDPKYTSCRIYTHTIHSHHRTPLRNYNLYTVTSAPSVDHRSLHEPRKRRAHRNPNCSATQVCRTYMKQFWEKFHWGLSPGARPGVELPTDRFAHQRADHCATSAFATSPAGYGPRHGTRWPEPVCEPARTVGH